MRERWGLVLVFVWFGCGGEGYRRLVYVYIVFDFFVCAFLGVTVVVQHFVIIFFGIVSCDHAFIPMITIKTFRMIVPFTYMRFCRNGETLSVVGLWSSQVCVTVGGS